MPILVRSGNLHEKLAPTAFAIDKDPRQAVRIIRCASDARKEADRGEIPSPPYELGGRVGKASEGIGEVIDRHAKRRSQRFAAAYDFLTCRFVADFLKSWM
jgi:hypothetical protein